MHACKTKGISLSPQVFQPIVTMPQTRRLVVPHDKLWIAVRTSENWQAPCNKPMRGQRQEIQCPHLELLLLHHYSAVSIGAILQQRAKLNAQG